MRIGLVGCVKTKGDRRAPAKDLYTSPLFVGRRGAVEASCDRWFILSAKHGLVEPDELVEPYDVTLSAAPRRALRTWSSEVLDALRSRLSSLKLHTFEIHAGSDYYDWGLRDGLTREGATVVVPTEGLSFGQSLGYYGGASSSDSQTSPASAFPISGPPTRGKYGALADHLASTGLARWEASFSEIEKILGRTLPASARRHAAWWSNTHSHSHASAWLDAGYLTSSLSLTAERVTFERRS